ncbi:MAG: sel1 repeat family protein [Bacteroidaceae bacterium]|nr:sel1 repeat family protein [Bacteroidaceae bacterium]
MKHHPFLVFLFTIILCSLVCTTTFAQGQGEVSFLYSDELLQAAQKGDPDAMYKIGLCYYVGNTGNSPLILNKVPFAQDYKEAMNYLTKAAKKGSSLAMINIGNIYRSGVGAPKGKDIKEALKWYEKAAKNGYVDAFVNIGQVYEKESIALIQAKLIKTSIFIDPIDASGNIWENTRVKAVDYYRKAAEMGSALGAYNMAVLHTSVAHQGVARDYHEGLKWYRKAVQLGNKRAMVNIAQMYNQGQGVRRNRRAGIKLMCMAAESGEPQAIHNIGVYYFNGTMLPMDKEKALVFFLLANNKGYNNSKALTDCYKAGVHNADKYITEAEWLETVRRDIQTDALPTVEIPQVDTLYTTDYGYVINDCSDYYIISEDGICLTEHRYDKMVVDEKTSEIKAVLNAYVTSINEDYSESEPILDQMLDKMVETPNLASGIADLMLRLCYEEQTDYRAIAYYNMAASLIDGPLSYIGEMYLRKSLDINPQFELAQEQLKLLEKEKKERKKAAKKRKRQFIMECVNIGLSGLSDIAGNLASIQSNKRDLQQRENERREMIRQKNKAKVKENKAKLKEGKREIIRTMARNKASRAYSDEMGLIYDMKLYPDHYDEQAKQQIQSHMKQMREDYGLQYNELEDW